MKPSVAFLIISMKDEWKSPWESPCKTHTCWVTAHICHQIVTLITYLFTWSTCSHRDSVPRCTATENMVMLLTLWLFLSSPLNVFFQITWPCCLMMVTRNCCIYASCKCYVRIYSTFVWNRTGPGWKLSFTQAKLIRIGSILFGQHMDRLMWVQPVWPQNAVQSVSQTLCM